MSDVDSFWRKRVEREEAEIANRLAQMQSGLSRHAVSKSSFNVMGVPQIIRRAGAGSLGGRVAKSEVLRVNHVEAAPAFDNPFMSSASEAGVGAARLERAAAAGDAGAAAAGAAAARLRGAGASRGSSAASSMGMPPFNEFTTPPSPSVAPSTFSYPATPNFSEGGTSAVDPELLERLERLEMALAEEKKARAHVEQRLQKIKEEEEEEKKSSAGVSGTAKSGKAGVQRLGTTAVAAQRGGGKVSSALAPGTTAPRAASKPSARAASSVVKRGSFR